MRGLILGSLVLMGAAALLGGCTTVKPGDRITVTFPISERSVKVRIGGDDYSYTLRGNTVISVDPPGKNHPIYQREYYRSDVRWRTVSRFVPSDHVEWSLLPELAIP